MEFTDAERQIFSKMGQASRRKKFEGMRKEEISEYMKKVRRGKNAPQPTASE